MSNTRHRNTSSNRQEKQYIQITEKGDQEVKLKLEDLLVYVYLLRSSPASEQSDHPLRRPERVSLRDDCDERGRTKFSESSWVSATLAETML